MDWLWLFETVKGCIWSIVTLVVIVIPLMIIIEFFKEFGVINKLTPIFLPILKILRLPKEAVFPLLSGIIFGISYGAGVIIQSAREGIVKEDDLYTMSLFLVVFHSLIEDTMLFLAVGANFWLIVIGRFFLAIIITYAWVMFRQRRMTTTIQLESINIEKDTL